MIPKKNAYNSEIPEIEELENMNEAEITKKLEEYLAFYQGERMKESSQT